MFADEGDGYACFQQQGKDHISSIDPPYGNTSSVDVKWLQCLPGEQL